MDKFIKIQKYTDKLLEDLHISVNRKSKYNIVKHISLYIDSIIFNIISVFCLIAILNTPIAEANSEITHNTIKVGKQYINDTCKPKYNMYGGDGRMGSATFLGTHEPMYSASNPTNDILKVDFSRGIARPQIGGAHKANASLQSSLHKIVQNYIKEILAYHKVTAKRDVKQAISNIIIIHLDCFIDDLKHHNGVITVSALKNIVKSHKILQQ